MNIDAIEQPAKDAEGQLERRTQIDSPKPKKKPEHKHELIYLTHTIKQRIRRIIRRNRNKRFYLHLKRKYKREARDRKLLRRSELLDQKKRAEKAALKKQAKKDGKGKSTKGEKGNPKKDPSKKGKKGKKTEAQENPLPPKPARRHQKWRDNKYRKWRQYELRSNFIRREEKRRLFRKLHPATRPFKSITFGWSYNQQQISKIHQERLAATWNRQAFPPPRLRYFSPRAKTGGYLITEKPTSVDQRKERLRKMFQTEWKVENYDRLMKNSLVKAMARLILMAKERYDAENPSRLSGGVAQLRPDTTNRAPVIVSGQAVRTDRAVIPPSAGGMRGGGDPPGGAGHDEAERETENQALLRKQLQIKIKALLDRDPGESLRHLKKQLLPKILRDAEIRRNTYINRKKTFYDSYLRRKLQGSVLAKSLEHYQRPHAGGGDAKLPTPYRRYLVGYLRPEKIFLPGAQMLPSHARMGDPPAKALSHILPYQRTHIKKVRHKRQKYQQMKNPHFPAKEVPKKKKKKKEEKEKGKGKGKSKPAAKSKSKGKGKGTGGVKGPPPKETAEWRKWHRGQKRQRRKRKLKKWIIHREKRRRIKIAEELRKEANFEGQRDLRGMRQKIGELEIQYTKANQLINYLSRRNDYIREQHNDAYTKKHSEYFAVFTEWRAQYDDWFFLKDQIDRLKLDIDKQAADFTDQCSAIIKETNDLEDAVSKELSNFEIDYQEIMQFLEREPHWEVQLAHLETRPLYYEFLYQFRESAEFANAAYISDLLQRKMRMDFMNMATAERKKLRRKLPGACKRMLDERGLLAQEENKIRIWCNRLQRRRDKIIVPEQAALEDKLNNIRAEKGDYVRERQEIMEKTKKIDCGLKGSRAGLLKVNYIFKKAARKLTDMRNEWKQAKTHNAEQRAAVEELQKEAEGLRGVIARDEHRRGVYIDTISKIAQVLKKSFGISEDYYDVRWPSPNLNTGEKIDTNAGLESVLQILAGMRGLRSSGNSDDEKGFFISEVAGFNHAVKAVPVKAGDWLLP